MVTIEDAEAIVAAAHADGYGPDFFVAQIWENTEYFAVSFGHRRWFIDADESYVTIGGRPVFVHKESGAVRVPPGTVWIVDCLEYVNTMDLVRDYVGLRQTPA